MPKIANHKLDKIIGANIAAQRVRNRVSQTDLSLALNISYQQVQKYENGTNAIKATTLYVVAYLLGQPVPWFFVRHAVTGNDNAAKRRITATVRGLDKRTRAKDAKGARK